MEWFFVRHINQAKIYIAIGMPLMKLIESDSFVIDDKTNEIAIHKIYTHDTWLQLCLF